MLETSNLMSKLASMRLLEQSALASAHQAQVRPFLDVIDALKDLGVDQQLSLPQIVVVGDQSSGKSSVLEAISGIPFPRGSGLCTRCPIRTIMKRSKESEQWRATAHISWREPQPAAAGEIQSPEEIADVIRQLSDAVVAASPHRSRAAISSHTIVLRVTAPNVPDLSLVDLPGIVRTATSGQSRGVIAEVDALIESYIQQENTIILAVVPANQDIATVDILERAQQVDPEGRRTIGVLTKPDLVGPGNEDEVLAVLMNVRKPLRLGYYMVRNLSEAESREQPSAAAAQETAKLKEREMFETHPVYSRAPKQLLGVGQLTDALTKILVQKVKQTLPTIKTQLEALYAEIQFELASLGSSPLDTPGGRHRQMMQLISDFGALLRQSIRGEYRNPLLVQESQLRLHATYQDFYRELQAQVESTNPELDALFSHRISDDMASFRGRELCGFVNNQVFFTNVVRIVESWRPLVEHCRTALCTQTRVVAGMLIAALAARYPAFSTAVEKLVVAHVAKLGDRLQAHIDELFAREEDPFTTDRSLMDAVSAIRFRRFDEALQRAMQQLGDKPQSAATAKAQLEKELGTWYMGVHGVNAKGNVEEMRTLVQAYWEVARRRFVDNVCLTMEQDVVASILQDLDTSCIMLVSHSTDDQAEELLAEDSHISERRKRLLAKCSQFRDALRTLQSMS